MEDSTKMNHSVDHTYLIASPGRTGSMFLKNYLENALGALDLSNQISATHDATLQLPSDTMVICSRRRDLWQQTLSAVIAQYFGEWTEYSNRSDRISIRFEDFENKYVWNLRWFEAFDYYTSYPTKIDIFYEDFIRDPGLLNRCLGLPEIPIQTSTFASPYRSDRVENLQELKDFFCSLEQNTYLQSFPVHERCWQA